MKLGNERAVTAHAGRQILTNIGVWSPDGEWIVYDTRSDAAGACFDGTRIEIVHVETGEVRTIYESQNGACCGVATWHPHEPWVIFILGPEHPTPQWDYGISRRQGVIVDVRRPGVAKLLDARDLSPPFTPGALRGGSHVHVFSPDGKYVSFTYDDEFLARIANESHEGNQRNVGVSLLDHRVTVPRLHDRNHNGSGFSVLVSRTHARPTPGSDEIRRAYEEGWIGQNGYCRKDGSRQKHALACLGNVITAEGNEIAEIFVIDLPENLTIPGDGPLEGTTTQKPFPPRGTTQRRLTDTSGRKYPGIQGPRHWLRSSPDGERIAFLIRDDAGIVQFATISPGSGEWTQLTNAKVGVESAFSWNASGTHLAAVVDGHVSTVQVSNGAITPLSIKTDSPLRPEACVFSPDGRRIAFVREVNSGNQIFLVDVTPR